MSTVFELIIQGEIPGRFVWSDEQCVVFATIEPVKPGHMLVVPRQAVDKWTDLSPETWLHLAEVAQTIGRAQEQAFEVARSTLVIAGFEVPHTHIHVIPATSEADASLANAQQASEADLDAAAQRLREALLANGFGEFVPPEMSSVKH